MCPDCAFDQSDLRNIRLEQRSILSCVKSPRGRCGQGRAMGDAAHGASHAASLRSGRKTDSSRRPEIIAVGLQARWIPKSPWPVPEPERSGKDASERQCTGEFLSDTHGSLSIPCCLIPPSPPISTSSDRILSLGAKSGALRRDRTHRTGLQSVDLGVELLRFGSICVRLSVAASLVLALRL